MRRMRASLLRPSLLRPSSLRPPSPRLALGCCLVLVCSFGVACQRSASSLDGVADSPAGATGYAVPEALEAMPRPSLDRLEGSARKQVEDQQARVDGSAGATAEAWGDLGQLYWAYELYDAADVCFANAVHLAPSEPRWIYFRGVTAEAQGRYDDAVDHFQRTSTLHAEHLPSLLRLGHIALERHQLSAAKASFQRVLSRQPNSAAAFYGLGRVAALQQDAQEAVSRFEQSLRFQPDASAVHHQLGLAYRDLGRMELAKEHLAQSGARRPRFEDPWTDAAMTLVSGARMHLVQGGRESHAGRLQEALRHFRRAVEIDPELPQAHHNLGATLGALGQHGDALASLEASIELEPNLADVHFDRAMALRHLSRPDDAIQAVERAIELDPGDRDARRLRASLLHGHGRSREARSELRRLLREDPQDSANRLQLAPIEEALGDHRAAVRLFAEVGSAEPDRLPAHLGVVRLTMASQQFSETKRYLLTTLEAPSLGPATRMALEHLLARLLATCPDARVRDGNTALELARKVFQQAPQLGHGETVAMALAETGRFAEAQQLQQQLVEQGRSMGIPAAQQQRLEIVLATYRRGEPIRAGG